MADVLIYGDSIRSPELRHEVPLAVPDPFLYLERDGRRAVALHALEIPRVREEAPQLEILSLEALGQDELLAAGKQRPEIDLELALRACREAGIAAASVPASFPLELADHLRASGVAVSVDRDLFENRRRAKNETELCGIRNAQKACERALDAARGLLRKAKTNGGGTTRLDFRVAGRRFDPGRSRGRFPLPPSPFRRPTPAGPRKWSVNRRRFPHRSHRR